MVHQVRHGCRCVQVSIVSIIASVLSLLKAITDFLDRKRIVDAAEATFVATALGEAIKKMELARAARAAAEGDFDRHGINENDPNIRD